jgi:hypothetical protein
MRQIFQTVLYVHPDIMVDFLVCPTKKKPLMTSSSLLRAVFAANSWHPLGKSVDLSSAGTGQMARLNALRAQNRPTQLRNTDKYNIFRMVKSQSE